jgi:hypothetical protein
MTKNNRIPEIERCEAIACTYNRGGKCHTVAINVGDFELWCDTFFASVEKGGKDDQNAGVGACKVSNCSFNSAFECTRSFIQVKMISNHPVCGSFQRVCQ